jgi:hypothetical protein
MRGGDESTACNAAVGRPYFASGLGFANTPRTSPQECARGKQFLMRGKGREDEGRLGRGSAQVVHQQHAAVRAQVAMNQHTDIMVLRKKDAIFSHGLRQQGFVSRINCALGGMDDIVAAIAQATHGLRHDVGIREDAHVIRRRP